MSDWNMYARYFVGGQKHTGTKYTGNIEDLFESCVSNATIPKLPPTTVSSVSIFFGDDVPGIY